NLQEDRDWIGLAMRLNCVNNLASDTVERGFIQPGPGIAFARSLLGGLTVLLILPSKGSLNCVLPIVGTFPLLPIELRLSEHSVDLLWVSGVEGHDGTERNVGLAL